LEPYLPKGFYSIADREAGELSGEKKLVKIDFRFMKMADFGTNG